MQNHPLWHPLLLKRGLEVLPLGAQPGGSRSWVRAPPLPAGNRMAKLSVKPSGSATYRLPDRRQACGALSVSKSFLQIPRGILLVPKHSQIFFIMGIVCDLVTLLNLSECQLDSQGL